MKYLLKLATLFFSVFILNYSAYSSHFSGGDITYQSLGNNVYKITAKLFRDCSGIYPDTANLFIDITNLCTSNIKSKLLKFEKNYPIEVSQLCPAQLINSTCNGGTLPGMQLFVFSDTVLLSNSCNKYSFSWSTCCRNDAVNITNSSSLNMYLESTLNVRPDTANSSPVFTAQPIPYVCTGQNVSYNFGVTESDGDSIVFDLISAKEGPTTNMVYAIGYSSGVPMPGITIDSKTSELNFTPTTIGNYVVVVRAREYDKKTKKLRGTTYRDIQFVVQNCTNPVPDKNAGKITNLTGGAVKTGDYTLEMCEGQTFTFDAVFTDPSPSSILSLTSNITTVLPGATVTTSGTNPQTAKITWTAPGGSSNSNNFFGVTIKNDACPVVGLQSFIYKISVTPSAYAGPDQTICGNQSANVNASGGTVFTWAALPGGDPINLGVNFSCNPCDNPVIKPSKTTTYVLTTDLTTTCNNKDTITINVVPDFSFVTSQSTASSCYNQPIQLNATPTSAAAGYSYNWSPANFLDNASLQNPVANILAAGSYKIYVDVTSPFGCSKRDSVSFTVSNNKAPSIVINKDTTICKNTTFVLSATVGCDTITTLKICDSNNKYVNGTGTISNDYDEYPAPYGNYYRNAKHQFLIRASELKAIGMKAGLINALAFNVSNLNSSVAIYNQVNIKVACTQDSVINTWQTGLKQVYFTNSYTIVSGVWNEHIFNYPYNWDGVSNLVIEFCFDNSTVTYTENVSTVLSNTSYNSTIIYRTDNINAACPYTGVPTNVYAKRPNMRFGLCTNDTIPVNAAKYEYYWSPGKNLSDSLSTNPTITPENGDEYYFYVRDKTTSCATYKKVKVQVPSVSFTADPTKGKSPLTVDFTNTSSALIDTYQWSFGSTVASPTKDFSPSGTFPVYLIGTDIQSGCKDTAYTTIIVESDLVPNVFTPNGDGVNDVFKVEVADAKEFKCSVFNRWGKVVKEWTDMNAVWDGKFDGGSVANEGVYFYVVAVTKNDGTAYTDKGSVTLLLQK